MPDLGSWLGATDIRRMPYPVAATLQRARRAAAHDRPEQALQLCLGAVEATLRYTAARLLAETVAQGAKLERPSLRILSTRASMGDRLQLVGQCARLIPGEVPSLIASRWGGQRGLAADLGRIVQIRNQSAHRRPPSAREAAELLTELAADAACFEPVIERLSAETLVSIFRTDQDAADRCLGLAWSGPSAAQAEETIDLPETSAAPGDCYVISESGSLRLAPFVVATDDPLEEAADLWVVDRLAGQRSSEATWINVRKGDEGSPTAVDSTVLADLGFAEAASASETVRRARDRYYFATTPALMKRLMSSYVSRADVESAIYTALRTHTSAALWITAPPGSGKSTIICSIIRDYDAIHHFISAAEGRSDYGAILRSLIAQLADRMGMDLEPTSDDDALAHQLANLLVEATVAQTKGSLVVAVDALDELGSPEAVSRLLHAFPADLPDRVHLVVSSRPVVPALTLPRPTEVMELGPAGIDLVDELARRQGLALSPTARERAFHASGGNPLFVLWALVMLRDNPDAELDFRRNLDDFFGPVLGSALDGEDADDVESVLATLVAAQDPLDVATLCLATGLPRRRLLRIVSRISSLLAINGGEMSLAHRLIYEYLVDARNLHGIDHRQVRAAHRRLAAVALETPAYPERRRALHLVASHQFDEIVAEAGDKVIVSAIPAVAVALAQEDPQAVEALADALLDSDAPGVVRLLAKILLRLAEADAVELVRRITRRPLYAHLPEAVRELISLQVAHAVDDWGTVADTAVSLLENPGTLADAEEWSLWEGRLSFLAGDGLRIRGHHADALQRYVHAARTASPSEPMLQFNASFQVADLDYVYGRLSAAEARLFELLELADREGLGEARIRILREFGHIEVSRDANEQAATYYERGLALALSSRLRYRIAESYISLAEALASTDPARALRLADRGREVALSCDAALEAGKALYVRADARAHHGDFAGAITDTAASLAELTAVGYGSGCAHAHLVRAGALLAIGAAGDALESASEASRYYRREQIYPYLRAEAIVVWMQARANSAEAGAIQPIDDLDSVPHLEEIPNVLRRLGISRRL